MWKLFGIAATLSSLLLPLAAAAQDAAPPSLIDAQAGLAFRLLSGLEPQGNLTISPASLAGALAAIDPGADPAMHLALAKTLGYAPEEADGALAALRQFGVELAAPPGSGPLTFANAVFVAPGSGFRPEGFAALKAAGVEAREVAIGTDAGVAEVNEWVAERTANLIPAILSQPLTGAVLAAVNALHFKDSWAQPFPAEATAPGPFHLMAGGVAEVPLMALPATRLEVREDERFVAVSLPFEGNRFALTVVTTKGDPAPLADFAAVADWLSGTGFEARPALVTLPKFSAESSTDLVEVAESLGLAEGYSPGAFATFSDSPLTVSAIIQKTLIAVDETGAEASAATVVTMERSIAVHDEEPVAVTVDRPFLFALRDVARGLVLVAGYLANPAGAG